MNDKPVDGDGSGAGTEGPVRELNAADAPVLEQLRPYWQQVCALLLYKLVPHSPGVTITEKDLKEYAKAHPQGAICAVIGATDRFTVKLVTPREAQRLMERAKQDRGTA